MKIRLTEGYSWRLENILNTDYRNLIFIQDVILFFINRVMRNNNVKREIELTSCDVVHQGFVSAEWQFLIPFIIFIYCKTAFIVQFQKGENGNRRIFLTVFCKVLEKYRQFHQLMKFRKCENT